MLEKDHLEKRVALNDKLVKLALLRYELTKKKMIEKSIEEGEMEAEIEPKKAEIDILKGEEALILRNINERVEALRRYVNGWDE